MPKRFIFRLTHYKNLERYCADNVINAKNHKTTQLGYQTSYADIVERRGTDFSTPCGSVVNDFVPFYFSPSTPMAYTIHKGNVNLTSPSGENLGPAKIDDIAFIVADPIKVADAVNDILFTNIGCNSGLEPRYESNIANLETHVNWKLFDATPKMAKISEVGYEGVCKFFQSSEAHANWHNRSKERMAEFLVKSHFPMSLAECIVLKHNQYLTTVEGWVASAGLKIPVYVNPRCYF